MSFQGSIGEKEQCGLEQSKGALKQQGPGSVPWRWAAGGRTRLAGPRPAVLRENKSAEKRENEFHQAQITRRQSKAPRASQGQESRPGRAAGTPWARLCSRALQEGLHCPAPALLDWSGGNCLMFAQCPAEAGPGLQIRSLQHDSPHRDKCNLGWLDCKNQINISTLGFY